MQQDSNFPYTPSEESSDPPQLPFPEPGQSALPAIPVIPTTQTGLDALQLPLPQTSPLDATSTQNSTPPPPQAPSPAAQTYLQQPLSFVGGQMSMPGLIEIPFATQAISAVEPNTTEQEESQPQDPSNQDAKRAIINGVISLVVSGFTIATIAGLAGLVVGTFAIIYGLMGLRRARRLPNKTGEGQAVVGIVLGLIAWCIVITAFILRAPRSS